MRVLVCLCILSSVVLAGNCGVYSNGCEQFISSPWSSITEYKVSCSFSGYVKKIVKTVEYYSNSKCDDSSFIKNEYSFSFTNSNGNKDNATYTVTLDKATFRSNSLEALSKNKVICTPALSEGKTYNLQDVNCKVLMVDIWSVYKKRIGVAQEGSVYFSGSEDNKAMFFPIESLVKYSKVNNFYGCWEWWSIFLLIVVIIVVIVLIVFIAVLVTKKKSKKTPKKK